MYLHVIPERGLAGKVLLADLTFEGFLTGMDPQMVVKVAPVIKLPTTLLTFERSLACTQENLQELKRVKQQTISL